MDQFPTGFFGEVALEALHVIIHVGLGVPGVVLPQRPHEDNGDQARQEDDHHEGVEDGEPVDLEEDRGLSSSQQSEALHWHNGINHNIILQIIIYSCLVLKEGVVKIFSEPVPEWHCCGCPVDCIREG